MNMKTVAHIRHVGLVLIIIGFALSCQKEDIANQASSQAQKQATANTAARNNAQIVATTQDVANITSSAMAGQTLPGGRSMPFGRIEHHSDDCAPTITATFKINGTRGDTITFSGKVIIDFGDGSSCPDSTEVRKGKIIDSFSLTIFPRDTAFNLIDSITFQGFQRDSIKVDGLFVKTSHGWKQSTLDIKDAKITYGDGTFVTWSGSITTAITLSATTHTGDGDGDGDDDGDSHESLMRSVTGQISGTTRDGTSFSAEITKALMFDYSCSPRVPVSGTVKITVAGVESTLDYGDGTCDQKYTITTGGTTTEYTLKGHHH